MGWASILLLVFGATAYLSFNQFVRRGVMPVPDLVALPLAEAEMLLRDQGLSMRWNEQEDRFDESVAAGLVLEHDPGPGSLVKKGSAVQVVLSRGQQLVEVPKLNGQALQAAQVTLGAVGLSLGRRGNVYADGGEAGAVVWQSPPAGELVDRATPIDLMVSIDNTQQTYVMPDLVYLRDTYVRDYFEGRGFRLGSVKYEPYEGVPEGIVLRQYPLAGHPLRSRDVISLVVSAEPSDDDT